MSATVIYDADCGLCTRTRDVVDALDWLGTMRWVPLQSDEAGQFGIPVEELRSAVFIVSGDSTASGWDAVRKIALRVPLAWVAMAVAVRRNPWAAVGLALLFSPLAGPAGHAAYGWVAANRHRVPGSTCHVPVWDNQTK